MSRTGALARILLSLLLVLGQIGSFAHALSHLDDRHAHAGRAHEQAAAVDANDEALLEHEHVCDGLHAHADSQTGHGVEPVCELCAALGTTAAALSGAESPPRFLPRRSAKFTATTCRAGRFLFAGAHIRAPPSARA